jgi:hypothetical protein
VDEATHRHIEAAQAEGRSFLYVRGRRKGDPPTLYAIPTGDKGKPLKFEAVNRVPLPIRAVQYSSGSVGRVVSVFWYFFNLCGVSVPHSKVENMVRRAGSEQEAGTFVCLVSADGRVVVGPCQDYPKWR